MKKYLLTVLALFSVVAVANDDSDTWLWNK